MIRIKEYYTYADTLCTCCTFAPNRMQPFTGLYPVGFMGLHFFAPLCTKAGYMHRHSAAGAMIE